MYQIAVPLVILSNARMLSLAQSQSKNIGGNKKQRQIHESVECAYCLENSEHVQESRYVMGEALTNFECSL